MTGNKLFDTILVALLTLASLGSLGVFIYTEVVYKRPLPHGDQENLKMAEEMKKKSFNETYKLKKIIVNLPQKGKRLKFLEIEPNILTFKTNTLDKLDEFKPIIIDSIIQITGKQKPEMLNTITGKILLQANLKKKINEILGYQGVKEVLFTKFVIQ